MTHTEVEPEVCTCLALRQAARRVTRLYDDALAPTGLGVNQYSILATLGRVGPSRIQDLAQRLVMDRSTLGHLLRPLEKRGFARLRVSEQDGRSRVAALTPAGRAVLARGHPLWESAQRRFASAFGAKSAAGLRTVLKKVAMADFGDSENEGEKRGRSQATATRRRFTD
jgi:DNA-binding MarR family transcriptional regulator